ncbi:MAG TPA: efflux transporter periplasmic adaptor subunit [Alcaligenaceae bacterium]|nr:efflux transporter periplasmic adaptor subunit [Alcaligenaceae bacterium]
MKLKKPNISKRMLLLLLGVISFVLLFVYVLFRSGPMASIAVTVTQVENKAISPAIFGIGTVESRRTYKIGPTAAGRLLKIDVDVGDKVEAGQVIGEMDPVDLYDKIRAQAAALKQSEAQRLDAQTRQSYAKTQARRYEQLFAAKSTSEENYTTKQHEYRLSEANLNAAEQQYVRVRSDYEALIAQRQNLKLIAPVDGIISIRKADPGTTLVAGQAAVEMIDPKTIWVNARFDQVNSKGLKTGLPARVVLRSDTNRLLEGHVTRIEPMADAITEEMSAKISFDEPLTTLPPVGELAEITVMLPEQSSTLVVPNASIKRLGGKSGVWEIKNGNLNFASVKFGAADLSGTVQVLEGLNTKSQIVVYSEQALTPKSRIRVVDHISGTKK